MVRLPPLQLLLRAMFYRFQAVRLKEHPSGFLHRAPYMMNFGKSRAKLMQPDAKKVTFANVAGLKEEKEELEEIVDFLRAPQKYTA